MVVAHPDDEMLWGGGLPIRFKDRTWTIICCSIPRADPIRAEKFFDVCAELGANAHLLNHVETGMNEDLIGLEEINLTAFDQIVTHNSWGEYGHHHHRHVHRFITENWKEKPIATFGFHAQAARGASLIRLSDKEVDKKWQAFRRYDYPSPYDGKPQWEHLAELYYGGGVTRMDPAVETYDVQ